MIKTDIVSIIIIALITSCSQTRENPISINFTNETNTNLLDSVAEMKIILLENNEDALMSCIDQVFYHDGNFIIYDEDEQIITKYDSTGKFLLKYGEEGQGPEEYTSTSNIDIFNNKICFSDFESKTLVFDLNNAKFLTSFNYLGDQIAFSDDNGYIVYNDMETESNNKNLTFYNSNLEKNKDTIDIVISSGYKFNPIGKFFRFKDIIYCFPTLNNTIYSIQNNCCKPYETIGFGKYQMPDKRELSRLGTGENYKKFMATDDKFIHGFEPIINEKYIAVRFWTAKRTFIGFINKCTRNQYFHETTKKQAGNFMYWIKGSFDDHFISPMTIEDLKTSQELGGNALVKDFLGKNEDEDSMVLVIWKLK